jgi:hypothetical protein
MNNDIFALLAYRLVVLLCGFGSILMGYRLFRLGIFEKAGELKANWGDRSLLLKAAAPGTFFALFGSAIIAVTVWKGFTIETSKPAVNRPAGTSPIAGGPFDSAAYRNAIRAALDGHALTDEQKAILADGLGLMERRSIQAK